MNERELFIERFKSRYNMKECNTPFGMEFSYGMTQDAFDVWQASANREGYKLVPVDALETLVAYGTQYAIEYDIDDLHKAVELTK